MGEMTIKYELHYTTGAPRVLEFQDAKGAAWFIHNEGDHLLRAVRLPDDETATRERQVRADE